MKYFDKFEHRYMWCHLLLFSVFDLFKLRKKQNVGTNWRNRFFDVFLIQNFLKDINNFYNQIIWMLLIVKNFLAFQGKWETDYKDRVLPEVLSM